MKQNTPTYLILLILLLAGCKSPVKEEVDPLDAVSDGYVKLALTIGLWDPDFVDAYYGPEEFLPVKPTNDSIAAPFEELKWKATKLLSYLEEINISNYDSLEILRYRYLLNQMIAVKTRLELNAGDALPFDVESRSLYDAVAPHFSEEYYKSLIAELDKLLPGKGSVAVRYDAYMNRFIIPEDKLDTIFSVAIAEAKRRTVKYIALPDNETFVFEYVTDKPWIGYNWYKGNSKSLIQVNKDFDITIDKALYMACHEGYPGHHVFNVLLENNLVDGRGWQEFSIYPLFSPQSLIGEGTANFGIELAFPGNERQNFEKEVLFPLAGLDPGDVDLFYRVQKIKTQLSYADNESAKQYMDGLSSNEEIIAWLMEYTLLSQARAEQRLSYYDKYGSYVINFNYGHDIIRNYIETQAGITNQELRWKVFTELLSTPVTASMIE
jgi:hypothetical protein